MVRRSWLYRNLAGAVLLLVAPPVWGQAPPQFTKAISREFSVFNDLGWPAAAITDAASREFSVFNDLGAPAVAITDAISREFTVLVATPELEVVGVDAPPSGVPGELVAVSWTVINTSTKASATGPWNERVYISADVQIGGDTVVANFVYQDTLGPGDSIVRNEQIPVLNIAGPYYVVVCVDADNAITELDESNNCTIAVTPSDVLLPDLSADSVMPATTVFAGQAMNVSWTVSNIGDGPASGDWFDRVYISTDPTFGNDILVGEFPQTTTLAIGASYTATGSIVVPIELLGDHYVIVHTDATDTVGELGLEGNNVRVATFSTTVFRPELPDLQVTIIAAPVDAITGEVVNVAWSVTNADPFAVAEGSWTDRIYISTDNQLDPEPAGADQLVHAASFSGLVLPQSYYIKTASLTLPKTPGLYFIFVVTDAVGELFEGAGEDNNTTFQTVDVSVPPYSATVAADIVEATSGTPIALSGQAVSTSTGTPVPNVPVAIRVRIQGTRRVFSVTTDAGGAFIYQFNPLPGEAGLYQVYADHPAVVEDAAQPQDSFTLINLNVAPAQSSLVLDLGVPLSGQVQLRNVGNTPVSGITTLIEGVPPNVNTQLTVPPSLLTSETAAIRYTLTASDLSTASGEVIVHIYAPINGLDVEVATLSLLFYVAPDLPELTVTPSSLSSAMLRGSQTMVEFDVANAGAAPATGVTVSIPCSPNPGCTPDVDCQVTPATCTSGLWLNLVTPANLGDILPGQSRKIQLSLLPSDLLTLGYYTGQLAVQANEMGVAVPFQFRAISIGLGDLSVIAEDELTFYGPGGDPVNGGGPLVQDASITIKDAVDGALIASDTSGTTGTFLLSGLLEGFYTVDVSAAGHGGFSTTAKIRADEVTEVRAFLPQENVSYDWTVVPTQVEDEYIITIESTFETNVPAPVITVDPALVELSMLDGETRQIDLTFTNHGLIAAQGMELFFADDPEYSFTPLISQIGTLAAQTSIVVPVTVQRNVVTAAAQSSIVEVTAADECTRWMKSGAYWFLICIDQKWYRVEMNFKHVGLSCPGFPSGSPGSGGGLGGPGGAIGVGHASTPTYTVAVPCEPAPTAPDEGSPDCKNRCGCSNPGSANGGTGSGGAAPGNGGSPGDSAGADQTHPVLLFSGEEYMREQDLRIRGRGMDFIWGRTYRSKIGPNTAQGNAWDFWFNAYLEQDGTNLTVYDGHGRRDTFAPQPDGTWGRDEFFQQIVKNTDNTYTLLYGNQGKRNYHAFDGTPIAGKLASMVDRNGNTMALHYDAQGQLIRITDTLDRDIVIAYNVDGFIASVTDFIGRQIKYEYYVAGDLGGSPGDLKSVTTPAVTGTPNGNDFPNGKTTVYTYSTGFADHRLNHNLLTITDPKGQTFVENEYYSTLDPLDPNYDRVRRQTWGNPGDIIDIVYVPQVPSAANYQAVMTTILNDRVGNVTEYDFDIRNRLIRTREFTGRADPDLPTTRGSNRPTGKLRASDPEFFESRYEWNTDSQPTRIIHRNGDITENVYEADLDPNALRRYRGNRRITRHLPGTHTAAGDQAVIEETFSYDTNFACGSCGFDYVKDHTDGKLQVTANTYDPNGNKTRIVHRIPTVIEDFEFNAFGQMTARVLPDNGSGHRRRDEFIYYTTGPQRGYLHQQIVDAGGLALTTTYEYDAVGNIIRVIGPGGDDTQYVVNQLDQIVRRIRPEVSPGSGVRYQTDRFFDANDNVVRTDIQNIDETGTLQPNTHFTTVNEYEILNRLVRTCEEVGTHTAVIPGTTNLPICAGLPASEFITTEYEYDASRNRTLVRHGEAAEARQPTNTVQTLYDERDLLFKEIRAPGDPAQATTQYDYDDNRNLIRRSVGLEDAPRVHTSAYDAYDRLVAELDPMGKVTLYHYDENGNMARQINKGELVDQPGGVGGADLCNYFFDGPVALCDPGPDTNVRLSEVAYVYDELDRMTRTEVQFFDTQTGSPISDGLAVTQTFYNDNSQVVRTVNDNNHETLTAYDTANRQHVLTDAKGNTVTYAYDADSNVISMTEVDKSDLGNPDQVFTTTYAYDGLERRIGMTDNVGNTTTLLYDSRSTQTKTIDALGNVVRYVFDGLNRLTSTVREMRSTGDGTGVLTGTITTSQTWDDTSRLTSQTDDNGNTTAYVYDPLDRKITEQYADGTVDSFVLDVHGNRIGSTDPNGNVVTTTFDLLNRKIRTDVVPGAGVSNDTTFEVYKYDGLSRLIHAEDDDSLVTRGYDSLSRVTRETLTIAKGASNESIGTTTSVYDGVGNLIQCIYPGGRLVSTRFDELERKKVISDQTGTTAAYFYVGPSRVERRDYGNGTRTEYTYDGITGVPNPTNDFAVKKIIRTRHTRIADGTVIDDRTYTWDKLRNKTQRKDIRTDGPQTTHDYEYGSIYRLVHTNVTDSGGAVARDTVYTLDGVGNRTSVAGTPNPGNYTLEVAAPEPADRQMNQYTSTSFDARSYDSNGNLIAIDSVLPGPKTVVYDYGNRMVRHVDSGNATAATYKYDALNRRIERIVNDGTLRTTRYLYNAWRVCEEQDDTSTTLATYVYGLYIDEVLNMRRGATGFFYHCDDLYNVMGVTDSVGAVAELYGYSDYGTPSVFDDSGATLPSSVVANPYMFTGRRFDGETEWFYYRTRYLNSVGGRFTIRDTIGIWGDLHNTGYLFSAAMHHTA